MSRLTYKAVVNALSNGRGQLTQQTKNKPLWVDMTYCPRREASYFDDMKRAGLAATVITSPHWDSRFYDAVLDVVGDHKWIEDSQGKGVLATSVAQIKKAQEEGKVAIILCPQDAKIIDDQLDFLRVFYNLGVRICEITHIRRNLIGDATLDSHLCKESGLSLFGVEVVKEMNRLGMVVDLAHSGPQTTLEAIELSEHPAIFTHTNANAVTEHTRNKSDEAIKALAKKGGVMGVTPIAPFCETKKGVWPTMEDFFKHIDHVSELVGVDHVGISLDIDEVWYWHLKDYKQGLTYRGKNPWEDHMKYYKGMLEDPYIETKTCPVAKGMESLACYPEIERGLLARGYSEGDVAKIMGGNLLRVLEHVWGG